MKYVGHTTALLAATVSKCCSLDWCALLVSLHLRVTKDGQSSVQGAYLTTLVTDVLKCCFSLQMLYLGQVGYVHSLGDFGNIVLGSQHCAQLTIIGLEGFACTLMNLQAATQLTRVALHNLESRQLPCKLLLPQNIQHADVTGSALFGLDRSTFSGLSLTQLGLGPGGSDWPLFASSARGLATMPLLPSSLTHLRLHRGRPPAAKTGFIDACDWQCLNSCRALQHLTLPVGYTLQGSLLQWVNAARQLYIVDHDC